MIFCEGESVFCALVISILWPELINLFIHFLPSCHVWGAILHTHTFFCFVMCFFFLHDLHNILYFISGCRSNCILCFLNLPLSLIYGPDEVSGAQTCTTCAFIFPSSVTMPAESVFQLLMAYWFTA